MDGLQFGINPYSFVSVPLFIVALTSTYYLVRFKDKTTATWYLIATLAALALGMAALFLSTGLVLWGGALWPASDAFAVVGMAAMIGFTYHCPPQDRSPEYRLAMLFGLGTAAFALGYSAYYAAQILVYRSFDFEIFAGYPFLASLTFLVALGVSIRRTVRVHTIESGPSALPGRGRLRDVLSALWSPQGRARVLRDFSLALSLGLLQAIASALGATGVLPIPLDVFAIGLSLLIMVVAIVYATWDHTTRQPSLTVKLVGLSLVTLMAILGGVGLFDVHLAYVQEDEARGLHVETVRRAVRANDLRDLPGAVAYVAAWPASSGESGTAGQAARLVYAGVAESDWAALIEEIRQDGIRTTPPAIWGHYIAHPVQWRETSKHASLRYGSHPLGSHYQYIAYPLVEQGWAYEVGFDLAESDRAVAPRGLAMVAVVVASGLFILFVFPRFFHASIVTPLQRLQQGVRQVNAGDLDVSVPVTYDDEVGFLTQSFNRMTASIKVEVAERRRAEGEARLLQTLVLAIAEADDLHAALGVTLRAMCEATGWIMGQAWLPRADGSGLELSPAWHGAAPGLEALRQASAGLTPRAHEGLPGRVWASKRPAWIRDMTEESNSSRAAAARQSGLTSALGIPVLDGNDVLAVLELFVSEPRAEEEPLIHFLSAAAAQLGTAIRRKQAEDEVRALNVSLEERVADRTRELSALYAVSAEASGALNLQTMLAEALSQTVAAVRAEAGAVFLAEDSDGRPPHRLRLMSHRGIPITALPSIQNAPPGEAWLWSVIEGGEPVLVADASTAPNLPEAMQRIGRMSLLVAPMRAEGRAVGVLGLARTQTQSFSAEEIALLASIADHLGVAVRGDRRRQQAIVLEERQRLARDLHDSVTQTLYGLVTLSEAGRMSLALGTPGKMEFTLTQIGQAARRALREMRLFIYEMQPPELADEGLAGALHRRLAAVEGRSNVQARLLADEGVRLPAEAETALYQIAQEALNNCLRHADAEAVTVRLRREDGRVVLEVGDDGRGFDPGASERGGMGLANMRKRAAEAGADLQVTTSPGKGTRVTVSVKAEG